MPGKGLVHQIAAMKLGQSMKPSRPGGKNRKYRGAAAKLNPPGFPKRDPVAGRPKRRPM